MENREMLNLFKYKCTQNSKEAKTKTKPLPKRFAGKQRL